MHRQFLIRPSSGLPKFFDEPRKELPFGGVYSWRDARLRLETRKLKGRNAPVDNFAWVGKHGRTLYRCARTALYRNDLLQPGIRP